MTRRFKESVIRLKEAKKQAVRKRLHDMVMKICGKRMVDGKYVISRGMR